MVKQMGLFVRTKSDSGKRLTDQQILQQIKVRDLDTGTEMDLAAAENLIPRHIDPMSKHIIRQRFGVKTSDLSHLRESKVPNSHLTRKMFSP